MSPNKTHKYINGFTFIFVKQRFLKNPFIISLRLCGAPAIQVLVYELLL